MPSAPVQLSLEEFLEREQRAEAKSEYYNGEVFAKAGGSLAHARLGASIAAILRQLAKSTPCGAQNGDLMVWVPQQSSMLYPDVSLICGEAEYRRGSENLVTNPKLIVEVVSPSSDGWDQLGKFEIYKTLPSFTEYLVIYPYRYFVQQHVKADGSQPTQWASIDHAGLDAVIHLDALGKSFTLAELYEGIPLGSNAGFKHRDLSPEL